MCRHNHWYFKEGACQYFQKSESISTINLLRFRITMKTNLWADLMGRIYLFELTEVCRLPPTYKTAFHGPDILERDRDKEKTERQRQTEDQHLSLSSWLWRLCDQLPYILLIGFFYYKLLNLKLWTETNASFEVCQSLLFCK